jgi:hypothetical protein
MKMPHESNSKRATLAFALLLSFVIGTLVVATSQTSAQPTNTKTNSNAAASNCSSVTDAQIVSMIQRKIRKTPLLNKSRKDIQVQSNNHEVTLDGCATNAAAIAQLVKYAEHLHCVTKVTNNLRVCNPTGCLQGQQQCPDGSCIPRTGICSPPPPKH